MTLFRVRQYGKTEWAMVSVNTPGEEDDTEIASLVTSIIGSALGTSELHVQSLNGEGEWEDVG